MNTKLFYLCQKVQNYEAGDCMEQMIHAASCCFDVLSYKANEPSLDAVGSRKGKHL